MLNVSATELVVIGEPSRFSQTVRYERLRSNAHASTLPFRGHRPDVLISEAVQDQDVDALVDLL